MCFFISQALFGRHIWALRLPVVLVSLASIFLTLKFEPFVGRWVSRIAAFAMAISPAFIFYGRYSIHEVWLLFFSMLFIFGLLGLWKQGTRGYLWCVGIGVAGMILTKETYIIHIGCALDRGGRALDFASANAHARRQARSATVGPGSTSRSSWARGSFSSSFFTPARFSIGPG